jgi:hypothetical protein
MLNASTELFDMNGCHNIAGRVCKRFKRLPPAGCGRITMTAPTLLWVGLHQSRNWPWLHNASTSDSLAKREDYPQTGGKQRTHEAIGTIRFTSPSEITNHDNVLFQATPMPVYSGMTLLSEKLVYIK